MHDFSCTKPQDMYYKILADRVRYFKEDKKGILTMCREMENMRRETAHEKSGEISHKCNVHLTENIFQTRSSSQDYISCQVFSIPYILSRI